MFKNKQFMELDPWALAIFARFSVNVLEKQFQSKPTRGNAVKIGQIKGMAN
jgi:hypothetical protein